MESLAIEAQDQLNERGRRSTRHQILHRQNNGVDRLGVLEKQVPDLHVVGEFLLAGVHRQVIDEFHALVSQLTRDTHPKGPSKSDRKLTNWLVMSPDVSSF